MPAQPWIDISLPIDGNSVAWAGIATPRLTAEAAIDDGDAVNVGRLALCLHTGTHADAPSHVRAGAAPIADVPVERYVGPARLVRCAGAGPITRAALEARGIGPDGPSRLLLASDTPYDGERFPTSVPAIDPDAARWLAACGVQLVGVDVPSVDPLDSKALEAHHALLGAGVAIVENLLLAGLPEGDYDLVALPLRIKDGDASPVRAVVRRRG